MMTTLLLTIPRNADYYLKGNFHIPNMWYGRIAYCSELEPKILFVLEAGQSEWKYKYVDPGFLTHWHPNVPWPKEFIRLFLLYRIDLFLKRNTLDENGEDIFDHLSNGE